MTTGTVKVSEKQARILLDLSAELEKHQHAMNVAVVVALADTDAPAGAQIVDVQPTGEVAFAVAD